MGDSLPYTTLDTNTTSGSSIGGEPISLRTRIAEIPKGFSLLQHRFRSFSFVPAAREPISLCSILPVVPSSSTAKRRKVPRATWNKFTVVVGGEKKSRTVTRRKHRRKCINFVIKNRFAYILLVADDADFRPVTPRRHRRHHHPPRREKLFCSKLSNYRREIH